MRSVVLIMMMSVFSLPVCSKPSGGEPDSLAPYFQFDDVAPLSCLFTYFPPLFIQHGIELKSFIRSKIFREIRQREGDPRAVDAIYIKAMQMTNNNTAMALLISAIACFDHQMVGIKIPVFNFYFPISNESDEQFARRLRRLPVKLYPDSPAEQSGDRDKLQHFLGSAFLTFIFESRDAAFRIGDFVEKGEEAFIVGGVNDDRDRRANRQGQDFGIALLDDNHRLPSEFFRHYISPHKMTMATVSTCSGAW